jgi:hypothetical protein
MSSCENPKMGKFEQLFIDPIEDEQTALNALRGATYLLYFLAAIQLFFGSKNGMTLLNAITTFAMGFFIYRWRSRFLSGCLALVYLNQIVTGFPDGFPVLIGGIFLFVLSRATWASFKFYRYQNLTLSIKNILALNLVALAYASIFGSLCFLTYKHVAKNPAFIYVGLIAIIPIYLLTFKGILPFSKNKPINVPILDNQVLPFKIVFLCLLGFLLFRFGCSSLLNHHQFDQNFTFTDEMKKSVAESLVTRPFLEKFGKGKKNRDKRLDQFRGLSGLAFLSFEPKRFVRNTLEKNDIDTSDIKIEKPNRAFVVRSKLLASGKLPPDGRSIRYLFVEVGYDMECVVRGEVDKSWYDTLLPRERRTYNTFNELTFNPFEEYENQKYGFYFKFPNGWFWNLNDLENMGSDLIRLSDQSEKCTFAIGEEDIFPVGIKFTDVFKASQMDVDGLLSGLSERLSRDDDYRDLKTQKRFFAGMEMGEILVQHRDRIFDDWTWLRTMVYRPEGKDKFIFLRYGCPDSQKDMCTEGFESIEKTWEWGRMKKS